MKDADKKRYINILLDEGTLRSIDDFRFKNRIATRTEAIRKLIEQSLNQKESNVRQRS